MTSGEVAPTRTGSDALGAALGLFLLGTVVLLEAAPVKFSGQASAWMSASDDAAAQAQAGLRYLPDLTLGGKTGFGAELSANGWLEGRTDFADSISGDWEVKPYRAWVRYALPTFEARAGLQKISFGSATLLRPLMWFDRIDPRDPLQLTDGVYGLLARYYFSNNANIWAWGLLGNKEPHGWDAAGSQFWKPEFGGRIQMPVPRGEIAATYHHRSVDWSHFVFIDAFPGDGEDRIGLDGKWDIGVGAWFEGMLLRQMWTSVYQPIPYPFWQQALTLGMDYTLPLGNGMTLLAEHMVFNYTYELVKPQYVVHFTGFNASYPLSMLDEVRAIVLRDWTGGGWYRYVSWQRTYDRWVFQLGAFWNPNRILDLGGQPLNGLVAGKGVQLTVVLNH